MEGKQKRNIDEITKCPECGYAKIRVHKVSYASSTEICVHIYSRIIAWTDPERLVI